MAIAERMPAESSVKTTFGGGDAIDKDLRIEGAKEVGIRQRSFTWIVREGHGELIVLIRESDASNKRHPLIVRPEGCVSFNKMTRAKSTNKVDTV